MKTYIDMHMWKFEGCSCVRWYGTFELLALEGVE